MKALLCKKLSCDIRTELIKVAVGKKKNIIILLLFIKLRKLKLRLYLWFICKLICGAERGMVVDAWRNRYVELIFVSIVVIKTFF